MVVRRFSTRCPARARSRAFVALGRFATKKKDFAGCCHGSLPLLISAVCLGFLLSFSNALERRGPAHRSSRGSQDPVDCKCYERDSRETGPDHWYSLEFNQTLFGFLLRMPFEIIVRFLAIPIRRHPCRCGSEGSALQSSSDPTGPTEGPRDLPGTNRL